MPVSYLLYRLGEAAGLAPAPAAAAGDASRRRTMYIGTRASKLARIQADAVQAQLAAQFPDVEWVVVDKDTQGDLNKVTPLHTMGAKSLWTKELEVMLLDGALDMVVHCLKDMPTTLPDGCTLGAILEREDPRDAVIMAAGSAHGSLAALPAGAVVGTSSVRRMAQVARAHPHLALADMRGNLDTRLRKLDAPAAGAPVFAALILAAAGCIRMGWRDRCTQLVAAPEMLWAVGQGALAIECRAGDARVLAMLRGLDHAPTALACAAERALMRALEGGCSVPIGVETRWAAGAEAPRDLRPDERYIAVDGEVLHVRALVVSVDGQRAAEVQMHERITSPDEAERFGCAVAAELRRNGADPILAEVNEHRAAEGMKLGTVPDLLSPAQLEAARLEGRLQEDGNVVIQAAGMGAQAAA